eukprot:m.144978 g.144978  ORF g.144978 m.144978 type:complete len:70 (-) comp23051_c0_seq13:647-856(-)
MCPRVRKKAESRVRSIEAGSPSPLQWMERLLLSAIAENRSPSLPQSLCASVAMLDLSGHDALLPVEARN